MRQLEPAPAFRFYVDLDAFRRAEFTKCGGLTIERGIETIEEGGLNDRVHILPERVKYNNITLSHGVTKSTDLWKWFKEGLDNGEVAKKHLTITLSNIHGDVVRRWHVENALPVKFEGPELDSASDSIAIETLELAHEHLRLE